MVELKDTIENKDERIYSLNQMLDSSTDNGSCQEDILYRRNGEFIKVSRYQRGNQKSLFKEHTLQWPYEKGQTMIYKTLHRKQKIEQYELH